MAAPSLPEHRNVIPIAPPVADHSTTLAAIEKFIVKTAYLAVSYVVLFFWMLLFPAWLQWASWAVLRLAVLNFLSIHARGQATKHEGFEHSIRWWPRGFRAIKDIRSGGGSDFEFHPREFVILVLDTVLVPLSIYVIVCASVHKVPFLSWTTVSLKAVRWVAALLH